MREKIQEQRAGLVKQAQEIQAQQQNLQQQLLEVGRQINMLDGKLELLDELDADATTDISPA